MSSELNAVDTITLILDSAEGSVNRPVAVEAGWNGNHPGKLQWREAQREEKVRAPLFRTPTAEPGSLAYNREFP